MAAIRFFLGYAVAESIELVPVESRLVKEVEKGEESGKEDYGEGEKESTVEFEVVGDGVQLHAEPGFGKSTKHRLEVSLEKGGAVEAFSGASIKKTFRKKWLIYICRGNPI